MTAPGRAVIDAEDARLGWRLDPAWSPPPAPTRQTHQGRFCRLVPLSLDHADALHEANRADAAGAIWDYLPYGPFDAASYRDWVASAARGADPLFFAIEAPGARAARPLGVASYLRIAPEQGSIEIGHICLSPALSRTPAATEALTLMIGWAFRAGYRRLEWKCNALNAASRRAALRLGLSFEGVFRQAAHAKGRNRDTAWYAAVDGEWPALEGAYAAWLDPANFDGEGRQRTALSGMTAPLLAARG